MNFLTKNNPPEKPSVNVIINRTEKETDPPILNKHLMAIAFLIVFTMGSASYRLYYIGKEFGSAFFMLVAIFVVYVLFREVK